MNWPTIKQAIAQAVKDATGLDDVVYANTQEAGYARGSYSLAYVDLILRSPQAVGTDFVDHEYDDGEDVLRPVVRGNRRFVVSVRITRENQADDDETVGVWASRLRARLRRPTILAALKAANVSIATIEPTIDADFPADNRLVSRSITDIVFLSSENDADDTDAGDYFDTVETGALPETDFDGIVIDDTVGPP